MWVICSMLVQKKKKICPLAHFASKGYYIYPIPVRKAICPYEERRTTHALVSRDFIIYIYIYITDLVLTFIKIVSSLKGEGDYHVKKHNHVSYSASVNSVEEGGRERGRGGAGPGRAGGVQSWKKATARPELINPHQHRHM